MASTHRYDIVSYPRPHPNGILDETTVSLARKLQKLRLEALKQAPEAFGSSHEVEERRGLELTFERLRNEKATTFVAVRHIAGTDTKASIGGGDNHSIEALLEAEWVGLSSVVGPEDNPTGHTAGGAAGLSEPPSPQVPSQNRDFIGYHIGGTYVGPSARRSGVGQKLISKCLERASAQGKSRGKKVVVEISVFDDNDEARGLYEKSGFRVVGKETREQQPRLIEGEMKRKQKMFLNMEIVLE